MDPAAGESSVGEAEVVSDERDFGADYRAVRERITTLVSDLDSQRASTSVPACPDWSVHDVIAHLAGVCSDILSGRLEGVTTPPWTAAQVEARRDRSMQELLEEWASAAGQVEPLAPLFPGRAAQQMVADVVSHEHDLRGALNRPGARDSEAVFVALDFLVRSFLESGLAGSSLVVRAGGLEWATPERGEAVLESEPFELMRALSGRRSLAQVEGLGWSVDPNPYLSAFTWGPFQPAERDLVE